MRLSFIACVLLLTAACGTAVPRERAEAPTQEREKFKCDGLTLTAAKTTPGGPSAWTTDKSAQDGIVSFSFCQYFKDGETTINRIDPQAANVLPRELSDSDYLKRRSRGQGLRVGAMPEWFTVYRDMIFEAKSSVVSSGPHRVGFRVPTISREDEFKRLVVLYLDENSMNPGTLEWRPYSDFELDLKADFGRRIFEDGLDFISVFNHQTIFARFALVTFDRAKYEGSPAADLSVAGLDAPPSARVGDTISVAVTIKNEGPAAATGVIYNHSAGSGLTKFVSAAASQGSCRTSETSDPVTICELGALAAGRSAKVTINLKIEDSLMVEHQGSVKLPSNNRLSARERDPKLENNYSDVYLTAIRR
ncbi:MAG: DUF11 domain-containing protein [Acidobacteria bacterium]|nr:DUF11 domain-containing protein [Acidobacteriota bacterium]